jgi:NAD(P)-dependent dehydrogenase (short-subunit alcohol dehydrogenase family)
VALVTGASRGLGAAMAIALAKAGADLALWARRGPGLVRTAAAIRALGRRAWTDAVDVADDAAVRAAATRLLRCCGRLDILVNNAGVWDGDPLLRLSVARWRRVIDTDLTAVFAVTQALAPAMLRRRGRIINISSTSAILAHPEGAAYGAAKAGLVHLTRTMATELGPRGVRVNGIAPGVFRTDMTADMFADREWVRRRLQKMPLRRFGDPEDLAGLVVFLASDASRHVTGQTLVIDGGATLLVG